MSEAAAVHSEDPALVPAVTAYSEDPARVPAGYRALRARSGLAWLGRPRTYAAGAFALTLVGAGTTLMAPRLLDPAAFGAFALLTSLFQYAGRADLGLSQLADQRIAGQARSGTGEALAILQTLWMVAGIGGAVLLPLALLAGYLAGGLSSIDIALAVVGGIAAMVANGPVTLFRASSRVWDFTLLALILQAGMTVPRLAGLVAGGVTGCFAALAAWYVACAMLFARPVRSLRQRPPMGPMVRAALPLFAFNASWLVYLTANRWIASLLTGPHDLGQFAFGASLASVGLGLMGTVAQVRYPTLLAHRTRRGPGEAAVLLEREILRVGAGLFAVGLVALVAAAPLVHLVFPGYEPAVPCVLALAAAAIPLGILVWVVPMVIVVSPEPGRQALLVLAPGFIALGVGMALGQFWGGIEGQAWGNAVAALLLFAGTAHAMARLRMIRRSGALRLTSLVGLAMLVLSAGAHADPAKAASLDLDRSLAALHSPEDWPVVFEDGFDRLSLRSRDGGVWQPHYPGGGRTNVENRESQYYVDPRPGRDAPDLQALRPFEVENGILAIRATPLPPKLRSEAGRLLYASGLLTTATYFSFLYGSAEIRARVPRGRGLWPAFWLLPEDRSWPPEIDVFEVIGHDPNTLHVTAHSGIGIPKGKGSAENGRAVPTTDLSEDFHLYGVTWTPQRIVWFLDGQPVHEAPTPQDMHKPMFLLVNLAVGGKWPGPPDAGTRFPAALLVDWIRVRAMPGTDGSAPVASGVSR